jgi:transposase
VAAPWARRTLRLAPRFVAMALALGGRAGGHLSHAWGRVVSRTTLRRVLRKQLAPSCPTPRGRGVADGALRKRPRDGTVLIALERRAPVALLPARPADTWAQWLQEHPGGQGIARDRAPASADGARHGAPAATQGADRLQLLQPLRAGRAQVGLTHGPTLEAVQALGHQQPVPLADGALAVPVPPQDMPLAAPPRAAPRQAHRQALQTPVGALHRQGWTAPAIAQQVGLSLRTVPRALRTATLAGRRRRRARGARVLNP